MNIVFWNVILEVIFKKSESATKETTRLLFHQFKLSLQLSNMNQI